jgi:hypothetical protein
MRIEIIIHWLNNEFKTIPVIAEKITSMRDMKIGCDGERSICRRISNIALYHNSIIKLSKWFNFLVVVYLFMFTFFFF